MKPERLRLLVATAIVWMPVMFFSALLSHNAILYFTHGGEYGILPEKIEARKDLLWNLCFYLHLPAGIICLITPMLLFAKKIFHQRISFHRSVGNIYVWTTLLLVCPTGMYLAMYAKGGPITQTGFMVQGILLAIFTLHGYQAIHRGDKILHVQHMIRSYAVATVVLSFRIYHILFFIWQVPYQHNYAISQWLGLSGNLLLAELLILFIDIRLKNPKSFKSQTYENI